MADSQHYASGPLKGGSPTLRPAFSSSFAGLLFNRKIIPQAIPRLSMLCSLYEHPKSSCSDPHQAICLGWQSYTRNQLYDFEIRHPYMFYYILLKIVQLVISIKGIKIFVVLENLNSTIFIKMLQNLKRKPLFRNRRVENDLRSLSNTDRKVSGCPSCATQRSITYVLLPA